MSLRRTPFFSFHQQAGAKLIDFGGWEMPLQYTRILDEHRTVREKVGLFDVSHMGELRVRGPKATAAVQYLVTNSADLAIGQAQYTCTCTPEGGVVDDLIVYRLAEEDYLLCVNASGREKDFNHALAHNPHGADITNESDDWAQVAVQGRHAVATLQKLTDADLAGTKYFHFARGSLAGIPGCLFARTGYTGEDGFEVFIPAAGGEGAWPAILEAGAEFGIAPIGLGARDTLRLEARLHLYGNDMDTTTTPLEAGLGWCVKLDKPEFVGRDALIEQQRSGLKRRLAGFVVRDRIPRPHCPLVADGAPVGEVTSGTQSPTLGYGIALGYVPSRLAQPGTLVQVDVRGKTADAEVVRGPFFKRSY